MSLYGALHRRYRRLPEPARRWAIEHMPRPMLEVRQRVVARLERGAEPEELYDGHYYDTIVEPIMRASADAMAASIERELKPRSVIDLGCGSGGLMLALTRLGIDCVGFDSSSAALERCRRRGLTVHRLDIQGDAFPEERAELAISTEVAEHVPELAADRFVDLLTTLAPAVLMTAAPPGSSGKDHVNEQPNEYWIEKFEASGLGFDRDVAERLRREWREAGVDEAFFKSLMVFRGPPGRM
jgi:SAM-dependent methyltransferase